MKTIITIFKKEMIDVLRDRRTLITMTLIPLVLYPLLMTVMTKVTSQQSKKAGEQALNVGIIDNGNARDLRNYMKLNNVYLVDDIPADSSAQYELIRSDSLSAIFIFSRDFDSTFLKNGSAAYTMIYRSTDNEFLVNRLEKLNSSFETYMLDKRFKKLEMDKAILKPIALNKVNLASKREQTGKMIGAIIPYFFIIFCFLGCMYPAIDLAAGEKERGTIETLLTTPANRIEIFTGKFLVVALSGLISAVIALVGLAIGVKMNSDIPQELVDMVFSILAPGSIALLLLILIPLTMFFASLMLTASIYSKSFKEAQSIISPLMIIIIIPSVIAFLPGMKLDLTMAMIPILNVSLAARDIISGTIEFLPLLVTFVSLVLLALLGILVSVRFFQDENNILN